MADSLWTSKLRYGLQLCAKVRLREDEVTEWNMKMLQITQNKMLRVLDNSSIKDKRSRKDMLEKLDLPSVNQLAAQIKLQEAWSPWMYQGQEIIPLALLWGGQFDELILTQGKNTEGSIQESINSFQKMPCNNLKISLNQACFNQKCSWF